MCRQARVISLRNRRVVPDNSQPLRRTCQIVASQALFRAQINPPQPLENFVRAKCDIELRAEN